MSSVLIRIKPEIDELGFNSNHTVSYCLKHVTSPFQEDVVYRLFTQWWFRTMGGSVSSSDVFEEICFRSHPSIGPFCCGLGQ